MLNQGMYTPAPSSGAIAQGRPKGSGTTYYVLPGAGINFPSTTTLTVNTDFYTPVWVATSIVVDQIAGEVTTLVAGQNLRFGLYAADVDLQPTGAPLIDSGDISTASTGVKTYTPGTPVTLPAGRYLQVVTTSASGCAIRYWRLGGAADTILGGNMITTLSVGRTYAAFPTPGTAWTTANSAATGGYFTPYLFRVLTP
jgi:hypothetical protein